MSSSISVNKTALEQDILRILLQKSDMGNEIRLNNIRNLIMELPDYKKLTDGKIAKIDKGDLSRTLDVFICRILSKLRNDGIVKRKIDTTTGIKWFSVPNEKAKAQARVIAYGSSETLAIFAEYLKLEAEDNEPLIITFPRALSLFLFPFWRKIIKAIEDKDKDSLKRYREQGGQLIASLFGVAVNTLASEEYRDELAMVQEALTKAENEEDKEKIDDAQGIRLAAKNVFMLPERLDFQTQWLKEKVEGMKEFKMKEASPYSKALSIAVSLGQSLKELNEIETLLSERLKDLDETEKQKIFDLIEIFRKYSGTKKEKG